MRCSFPLQATVEARALVQTADMAVGTAVALATAMVLVGAWRCPLWLVGAHC